MRVAQNRVIDASRREQTRRDAEPLLLQFAGEAESSAKENEFFPDERLKLLFVCAYPAIDVAARTPLMLQVVLGEASVQLRANASIRRHRRSSLNYGLNSLFDVGRSFLLRHSEFGFLSHFRLPAFPVRASAFRRAARGVSGPLEDPRWSGSR